MSYWNLGEEICIVSKVQVISCPGIHQQLLVLEGSISADYAHAQNEGPDQLTKLASRLVDHWVKKIQQPITEIIVRWMDVGDISLN